MSAYSLLPTLDAAFRILEGEASVMVRSENRMKIKSASVGAGELRLAWLPPGSKVARWRPQPIFISQESLEFTSSDVEDGSQLYDLSLDGIFPAFGLVKSDCSGVIRAPAVHFEPEGSPDFWVFLMHTGWLPPKPSVEVPFLSLADRGNEVNATIDVGNSGVVVSEVSAPERGFDRASLFMRRRLGLFAVDELVGEVARGTKSTLFWTPTLRDFGTLFIFDTGAKLGQFGGLLQQLGADVMTGSLERASLKSDFIVCDGPGIDYTLRLVGERGKEGDLVDEAIVQFRS
jgi:hypothetical protein